MIIHICKTQHCLNVENEDACEHIYFCIGMVIGCLKTLFFCCEQNLYLLETLHKTHVCVVLKEYKTWVFVVGWILEVLCV